MRVTVCVQDPDADAVTLNMREEGEAIVATPKISMGARVSVDIADKLVAKVAEQTSYKEALRESVILTCEYVRTLNCSTGARFSSDAADALAAEFMEQTSVEEALLESLVLFRMCAALTHVCIATRPY